MLTMPSGITPSGYFGETYDVDYVDDEGTELGISEILYTARGAQGMGIQ